MVYKKKTTYESKHGKLFNPLVAQSTLTGVKKKITNILIYLIYVDQILNRLSLGVPISITFSLQFLIVLIISIATLVTIKKMNHILIASIIITLVGIIIGGVNDWYLKDILADATRYIIPFLAFYIGLYAIENPNKAIRQIVIVEILITLINLKKSWSYIFFTLFKFILK